ncbi:MAG: hypothetical protein ACP6IY_07995 [Promethearchaeia archaeon]
MSKTEGIKEENNDKITEKELNEEPESIIEDKDKNVEQIPFFLPDNFKYILETIELIRKSVKIKDDFTEKVKKIAMQKNDLKTLKMLETKMAKNYLKKYSDILIKKLRISRGTRFKVENYNEIKKRLIISKALIKTILSKIEDDHERDIAIMTMGLLDTFNESITHDGAFDMPDMITIEASLSNIENYITDLLNNFRTKEDINLQNLINSFNKLDFVNQTILINNYFLNNSIKSISGIISILKEDNDKLRRLISSAAEALKEEELVEELTSLFSDFTNEGKKKFLSNIANLMNPDLLAHCKKVFFK